MTPKPAEQSQLFWNAIIENLPHMIFVKDAQDLRFVAFNAAGERLLGMLRKDLIGKNDYDLFPRKEADFFTAKDRSVISGGMLLDIPEEPIHTKNGTRWLHTKKIPILDENGLPKYLLGISEDITERRRNQNDLIRQQLELAHSNSEKEQLTLFAYIAAHDLREPLRKIALFGDILRERCVNKLASDEINYLKRIRDTALRMNDLISDLLRYAHATTGQDASEPVCLKTILAEVVSVLELLIAETGAKVQIGDLPAVHMNRVHAIELFQNLLSNAIKFRKKNETPVIIVDSRNLEDGGYEVTVKDNGVGFDEKFSERIFRPFERLDSSSDLKGSGIGLAICQRIMSRYGGNITASSVPGKGAVFKLRFPI